MKKKEYACINISCLLPMTQTLLSWGLDGVVCHISEIFIVFIYLSNLILTHIIKLLEFNVCTYKILKKVQGILIKIKLTKKNVFNYYLFVFILVSANLRCVKLIRLYSAKFHYWCLSFFNRLANNIVTSI